MIFTSHLNIATESGVYSYTHGNGYHQMTYPKFNLEIYYPSPYEWEIWHQMANIKIFRKAISKFLWVRCSTNICVDEKEYLFKGESQVDFRTHWVKMTEKT